MAARRVVITKSSKRRKKNAHRVGIATSFLVALLAIFASYYFGFVFFVGSGDAVPPEKVKLLERWAFSGDAHRIEAWMKNSLPGALHQVASTALLHAVRGRFATCIRDGNRFRGAEEAVADRYRRVVAAFAPHYTFASDDDPCPLSESVHYRLRSLTRIMAGKMSKDALQSCLLEHDAYGRLPIHVSSESKASGFARYYFRKMTPEWRRVNNAELGLSPGGFNSSFRSLSFQQLTDSITSIDLAELLQLAKIAGIDVSHLINAKDKRGLTPLLVACYAGRIDAVDVLMRNGADISMQRGRAWNESCLHVSAARGYLDLLRLLLLRGANTFALDKYNRTSWDVACASGNVRAATAIAPRMTCVRADTVSDNARPLTPEPSKLGWSSPSEAMHPRISSNAKRVERRSNLQYDEFVEKYFSLNIPVIISDLAKDWDAMETFSKAAFLATDGSGFGDLESLASSVAYGQAYGIQKASHRVSLSAFVKEWMHPKLECPVKAPQYIFDGGSLLSNPRFAQHVRVPRMALKLSPAATLKQLALGPCGSGVASHFHPFALNTLIAGLKKWFLTPRGMFFNPNFEQRLSEDYDATPHADNFHYEVNQRAGETLYVPSFMSHAVSNEADSIAVAFEFV